jgi:hypothetical protein
MGEEMRAIAAIAVVAATLALVGCGTTTTGSSAPMSAPESDAYSTCQNWADEGRSHEWIKWSLAAYLTIHDAEYTRAEEDRITDACFEGAHF